MIRAPASFLVFVGVALSCSATPIGAPRTTTRDFASGTRLLARGWDVDGSLVLRDFFDVERNEACAFVEDGQWRIGPGPAYWCLPVGTARHEANRGPFADAACKTPLASAPDDGSAYAIVRPKDACATPPRVHRAGDPKRTIAYFLQDGACAAGDALVRTQALGEEIPLASFVHAAEQASDVDVGARIAALALVADDGARMELGGFDHARNEPVRVDRTPGIAPRWVPLRVAFSGGGEVLFGDAACSASVATKLAYDAACPLTAMVAFDGPCASVTYHALGDAVRSVYRSGKTCDALTADAAGVIAYRAGAPIDPAAFAPAIAKEAAGPRVKRRGYAGPDGATTAAWAELVDATTNEPCEPALAADGVLRCLPAAVADVSAFADASCTAPAFVTFAAMACERPQAAFVRASGEAGARVFHVTGDAPRVYERKGAACVDAPALGGHGFAVEEIDVGRFATVTEKDRL